MWASARRVDGGNNAARAHWVVEAGEVLVDDGWPSWRSAKGEDA